MRINIYAEELTDETELIAKPVYDPKFGHRTFYGVRVYLKSPSELHSDPEDDDRSAITFWIPWTRKTGYSPEIVRKVLERLLYKLEKAPDGTED